MTYRKADCIELIDSNMSFTMLDPAVKAENCGVSTWIDNTRWEFNSDNEMNIQGSDLVKVARIFGVDASEEDVVSDLSFTDKEGRGISKVERAGDIQIPIWKGWPRDTVVYELLVCIAENGSVDIRFREVEDGEKGEITYNGRYYVEWSQAV